MENTNNQQSVMERFATKVSTMAGSSGSFIGAVLLVVIWLVTGPIFDYSTNWQLVINTGTTIITFLMVFLIQKTANKDNLAIQLKLNELIACNRGASNRVIDVEDMSEEELNIMHDFYEKLAILAKNEKNIHAIYSIDTAKSNHNQKNDIIKNSPSRDILS